MKTYLLLTTCLILTGCSRQASVHREAKSEQTGESVRWAFANKSTISTAIYVWSRDKMEEAKKAEKLSPEVEDQIRQYEVLAAELNKKEMEMRMSGSFPAQRPGSAAPTGDKDYDALTQKVAEAKAPIADIIDRRSQQSMQYYSQYTTEKLVAEYVTNRFDLVVDSSSPSGSAVLYRKSDEVLDITDGVIKLFKEETKP
jgi:hypothetical protein